MSTKPTSNIQRIAIASHPLLPEAIQNAKEILPFLKPNCDFVFSGLLNSQELIERVKNREFDVLIALGGDGTMLRAGHLCAPVGLPILGINLGRFGFLTEISQPEWRKVLPKLFTNEYWIEHRMMVHADLIRSEQIIGRWEVLNEVVISRGHVVRPITIQVGVDGYPLTTYVADGIIASTATGSTAYALAAGGPILPPELRNILLVAVAPHLSVDRVIILAEGSSVNITVLTNHPAVLSADGQAPIHLENNDKINVSASHHTAKFIHFQDSGYFYRNLTVHMSQNPTIGNPR